jgi:hypothetical protein
MPITYRIDRCFAPHLDRERETIEEGLTLEEAQEHCQDEESRDPGEWFDSYIEED